MGLTASDRAVLLKKAASLPKGDAERRSVLAGLKAAAWSPQRKRGPRQVSLQEDFAKAIGKRLGLPAMTRQTYKRKIHGRNPQWNRSRTQVLPAQPSGEFPAVLYDTASFHNTRVRS